MNDEIFFLHLRYADKTDAEKREASF